MYWWLWVVGQVPFVRERAVLAPRRAGGKGHFQGDGWGVRRSQWEWPARAASPWRWTRGRSSAGAPQTRQMVAGVSPSRLRAPGRGTRLAQGSGVRFSAKGNETWPAWNTATSTVRLSGVGQVTSSLKRSVEVKVRGRRSTPPARSRTRVMAMSELFSRAGPNWLRIRTTPAVTGAIKTNHHFRQGD